MLRSSRLGYKEIQENMSENMDYDTLYAYGECRDMLELQEGDQMTGWEIISTKSLEDQQELDLHHLPKAFKDVLNDYDKRFGKDHYSFLMACKSIYTWDGNEWIVGNGHKFEIVLK
jgi:hypothetical protein